MARSVSFRLTLLTAAAVILVSGSGRADEPCCTVPDNGTGTATLPPIGCTYQSHFEPWEIIDGLPPGTTIELDVSLQDFICCQSGCPNCSLPLPLGECEMAGGILGGHGECFESTLDLQVRGTGELAGFNRHLAVPVFCEVHTGPRNPGDPVQTFPAVMYRLQGELFGDPDFCTLRIAAGTDLGLPSPGQTTLTELPSGDFAVDSFFDITYQIEFEGCPASQLQDYSGTTTATKRISICEPEQVCEPMPDGSACKQTGCTQIDDQCLPRCVNFDPRTGQVTITNCDCRGEKECHVDISQVGTGSYCTLPDNGTGTPDLPPIGCEYTSPDEKFMIIDGLPPGTTIEMEGTHMDFICCGDTCQLCTALMRPGQCEVLGGSLGGHIECFDSTLDLEVRGTGELTGFNRHLAIPVFCEVHTGHRNPGDPVQTFSTDMYRLRGELFGDPDFCTLRITGGTDFGLPGPGQTTLTQLPSGDFAVDSFFDITYQIEFEGCPASQLQDYSGTTTATIRMQTGRDPVFPTCVGSCPGDGACETTQRTNPDGTIDICCDCPYVPVVCEPTDDGLACKEADCNDPNLTCLPKRVRHNIPWKSFPPAGVDIIGPIGGLINLEDPGGMMMTIPILTDAPSNQMIIQRGVPVDTGGNWVVPTEMVSMELSGDDGTHISLSDIETSAGQIIGSTYPDTDFPAESFFDVFVEVDLPGASLTDLQASASIHLAATGIDQIPPLGATYQTPSGWTGVELLTSIGGKTGYTIRGLTQILPPPPPEWEVIECQCMEHDPDYTFTVDEDCPGCADLNCDDEINFEDFSIMAFQWLMGCPE